MQAVRTVGIRWSSALEMKLNAKSGLISEQSEWKASFYHASADIDRPADTIWEALLDYQKWNPSFQGARVTRVDGGSLALGGRVLIEKTSEYLDGELVPQFYAETVALDRLRYHVCWYVYPLEGNLFRNFVDFRLVPQGEKTQFEIFYYEQNQLKGADLEKHRLAYAEDLRNLANDFKLHCDRNVAQQ
jgi:hypothetical protein